MQENFCYTIFNLFAANLLLGQNGSDGDFIEVGVGISTFIQSSFLEESSYSSQMIYKKYRNNSATPIPKKFPIAYPTNPVAIPENNSCRLPITLATCPTNAGP